MKKALILVLILVLVSTVLTGCMAHRVPDRDEPAGILSGIWHGWIAPIALVWSIFDPDVTIYEAYNGGWWYNFGFYMAIISGFGGLSLSRKRKKDN